MTKSQKKKDPQPDTATATDPLEHTIDVDVDDLGLPHPGEDAPAPSEREQNAHAAAAARSRPKAYRRPQVDPASLKIEVDVAIPAMQRKGRVSAWIPVLQQMEVGDSLNIPGTTANKIGYIRAIAKKLGLTVVIRGFDGGARLWRVGSASFQEDGL